MNREEIIAEIKDMSPGERIRTLGTLIEAVMSVAEDSGKGISHTASIPISDRELYTKAYNKLLYKADTSVESQFLGTLSSIGKAAGNLAAKSPGLDLLDVDDALIKGSKKLSNINSNKKAKELRRLESKQAVYVRPFLDNLSIVDKAYNEPKQIMFDDKYIYFPKVG